MPRTVLLIDQGTQFRPWFRQLIEAFADTIKAESAGDVYVYVENLGVDDFATDNYYRTLHSHFGEKYRGKAIGVIVCHTSGAMPYALRLRDELWPETPVILAGIPERAPELRNPPANATGFTYRHRLPNTVDMAHALVPGLKQIVLVGDRIASDNWRRHYVEDLAAVRERFGVVDLTRLSIAELKQRLGQLPADSAVAYFGISRDVTGQRYVPAEALRFVTETANRPIFVDSETFVGTGSIGGLVVSPRRIGAEAARLALRILGGERAAAIPIRDGNVLVPVFDWRQLQRWGISESGLPAGSKLRFRPPTAWEQYRWQIVLIALALATQTGLIVYILVQKRRRRAVEDSLAVSEKRVALTTASTNSGLWSLVAEDQPVQATQSCAALFGLEGDQPFTITDLSAHIHAEDRRLFLRTMLSALRHAAPVDFRFRTIGRDNRLRWIAAKGSWIPRGDGPAMALTGIFTDVTELKALEHERDQQRLEVTHLMRQSVVNQLSGSIAHELSQPLGAIMLNAEAALDVLDRERPDIEAVRASLRGIVERDVHASDIVGRVRRMIKKEGTKFESIEIEKLFEATNVLLRNELVRRVIVMEVEYPPNVPAVVGDFVQLQQVLINFLMNAMEAMNGSFPAEKKIVLSADSKGDLIWLAVSDNGPGIATGIRGHVLDAFVTTKPDGLGLGLSICDGLAKAHGGRISVENNPHGGATAALILPVPSAEGR